MATDVTITYTSGADKPTVAPERTSIKVGTQITWITPKGCNTTIAFSNGCPFPDSSRGSYSSAGSDITTQPAQCPSGEVEWPYTVTVTDKGAGSDPADGVIITQNP